MTKQKIHQIEVTERELRVILSAMDYAMENATPWWRTTKYVQRLYLRLRGIGLVSERLRNSL